MILNRNDVLHEAYIECLTEMYAKSQPPADFKKLNEDVKNGVIDEKNDTPIHDRHYLSYEEYEYILGKYCDAYGITGTWKKNLDFIISYFKGNGFNEVYVNDKTDEKGFKYPSHKKTIPVPSIENVIKEKYDAHIAEDISNLIIEYINNCKNFYKFDLEESNFKGSIALGCSPTFNKNTVIEYWKNKGTDIVIKERNPLLFWDKDYYGDEYETMMVETYGENWEEIMWEEFYSTYQGKKKMVNSFIQNNKNNIPNFTKYFVTGENENLRVYNFDDGSEILIDDFIEKYHITWKTTD